jgi:hypothetical protein
VRFYLGWGRIKNLWWNYFHATGKPYPLSYTQPLSHGTEGRSAVRGCGPRWSRILMSQNRLRYFTGTGTGTWTRLVLSFSLSFRCAVGTNRVRNTCRAARRRWGRGVWVGTSLYVEVSSFRSETGDFFPVGFTPFGHFFKDKPAVCSARIFDVVISPGFCLGVFAPGGARGGRPRHGGTAAVTSGGETHVLSRCVETTSVLLPICSWKSCRDWRSTRNGPEYGGVRGGAALSRRTKTKLAVARSEGKVVGSRVFLCEMAHGASSASVRILSKKSSNGGSPVARNSPGRMGWQPITASAGDSPPSRGVAVLIPRRTQGRCCIQSEVQISNLIIY